MIVKGIAAAILIHPAGFLGREAFVSQISEGGHHG